MANMRFSDLTTASILSEDDLLALSKVDAQSASGYMSYKTTLYAIALYVTKLANYTSDLTTSNKTVIGAINELKQLISLIPQFSIEVVAALPVQDISETTIYLVPNSAPEQGNYYEEYIYVNNTWELVGTTAVDLSAYYTKLEVDGLLAAKANTSDVTAALALKEAKADMNDDVTDIIVALTDTQTATGNPVTFTTVQEGGAKSALVTFAPKQSGTGDPSPSNIRPISGWDSLNLYQDTEQTETPETTYTATFPNTVYGGLWRATEGKAIIDKALFVLDSEGTTYSYNSTNKWFTTSAISSLVRLGSDARVTNALCENYKSSSRNIMTSDLTLDGLFTINSSGNVLIRDLSTTDIDVFKTRIAGVKLVFPLKTPQEITLTPADVNLLKGLNTVWTDGDTVQIKYSELPQGNLGAVIDYIKKLEARVKALEN